MRTRSVQVTEVAICIKTTYSLNVQYKQVHLEVQYVVCLSGHSLCSLLCKKRGNDGGIGLYLELRIFLGNDHCPLSRVEVKPSTPLLHTIL